MRIQFALLGTLTIMLTACGGPKVITLSSFDGQQTVKLTVEVADSQKERMRGLMERKELKPDNGMLFVFKDPQILTFWMKDTLIPLEIMYFDPQGNFVSAALMEPCKSDPCTRYTSQALSSYAVEVAPGYRTANGIGVGWKLDPKEIAGISNPS